MDSPVLPLLVCGGGPAGLMAAISAARSGASGVMLLEKIPACGRKLLASGSGQCNLTHSGGMADFEVHYGDNGRFLRPALRAFSNQAVMEFFASRRCALETEVGGKVFPATRRARDVLDALERECADLGVEIRRGEALLAVELSAEGLFACGTGRGPLTAGALCIATGGLSYPGTGSTGDGYALARSLGHRIVETGPALAALIVHGHGLSACAGISFDQAACALRRGGRIHDRFTGDVLITHRGLSGPGILDASRSIRPGDIIELGLLGPKLRDESAVDALLLERLGSSGGKSLGNALSGLLPARLLEAILSLQGLDPSVKAASLGKSGRKALARSLAAHPFEVEALQDISTAMATRGGVSLEEIDPGTMMSRIASGLFFAGEVLDIDGDSGGYNIQAAFSTGWLAGNSAAAWILNNLKSP